MVIVVSALVGCAGPRRTTTPAGDAELARLNSTARAAFNRGSPSLAAERFFRSARSFFAPGDRAEAAKCIEFSLALASEGRDEALTQRARQLQAEIRQATPLAH